jgi:hypothetical protein
VRSILWRHALARSLRWIRRRFQIPDQPIYRLHRSRARVLMLRGIAFCQVTAIDGIDEIVEDFSLEPCATRTNWANSLCLYLANPSAMFRVADRDASDDCARNLKSLRASGCLSSLYASSRTSRARCHLTSSRKSVNPAMRTDPARHAPSTNCRILRVFRPTHPGWAAKFAMRTIATGRNNSGRTLRTLRTYFLRLAWNSASDFWIR